MFQPAVTSLGVWLVDAAGKSHPDVERQMQRWVNRGAHDAVGIEEHP